MLDVFWKNGSQQECDTKIFGYALLSNHGTYGEAAKQTKLMK